jgi:hypothetical protein
MPFSKETKNLLKAFFCFGLIAVILIIPFAKGYFDQKDFISQDEYQVCVFKVKEYEKTIRGRKYGNIRN